MTSFGQWIDLPYIPWWVIYLNGLILFYSTLLYSTLLYSTLLNLILLYSTLLYSTLLYSQKLSSQICSSHLIWSLSEFPMNKASLMVPRHGKAQPWEIQITPHSADAKILKSSVETEIQFWRPNLWKRCYKIVISNFILYIIQIIIDCTCCCLTKKSSFLLIRHL